MSNTLNTTQSQQLWFPKAQSFRNGRKLHPAEYNLKVDVFQMDNLDNENNYKCPGKLKIVMTDSTRFGRNQNKKCIWEPHQQRFIIENHLTSAMAHKSRTGLFASRLCNPHGHIVDDFKKQWKAFYDQKVFDFLGTANGHQLVKNENGDYKWSRYSNPGVVCIAGYWHEKQQFICRIGWGVGNWINWETTLSSLMFSKNKNKTVASMQWRQSITDLGRLNDA